ncbi:MAG TPA: uracil-DNA glycosylase [Rhodocyclaceae bacterium]|nr:uracil-DNA glycosylase [Rhodocyclaceae bacterium]
MSNFPKTWLDFCGPQLAAEVQAAEANVAAIEDSTTVFPPKENRYRALQMKPQDVAVVILGQDPYHGEDKSHGAVLPQAMGLSFSVPEGMRFPPSLRNIAKELESDVAVHLESGDLSHWAEQGVLLLNTGLTVTQGAAGSHKKFGWHKVTDHIIEALGQSPLPCVFILWGAHAQAKRDLIGAQHKVIESVHPSPLSAHRGFFGSKPFSQTNAFLKQHGRATINW